MNFIKQIEASLKAINQARFQDLINHLLHIQGHTFIGAPGSVVAKEKTRKGTPDSFFQNGEKHVFVECTTQEKLGKSKSFIEKLLKDITHCFDEEETSIDKKDIERIILACTEEVNPSELEQLKARVRKFNTETKLEVYNIQNLPLLIYDFPGLSEQYLGVHIIKGEIYNLPDFLSKTTKGLQPSLINEFVGREDELKQSVENLHAVDILLLSGSSGVGKSKLAIAILEEIAKTEFIPIVIQSSAVPLWDDFIHLFQNGKNYVILFDDANKSVQNLTYLLDFIQKPKTNKLKLVITSRDYVKQQVLNRLSNSRYREVIVDKLKDKVIEEIILKALPNLQHHREITRKIVDLSKGNARVALMATYSVTPNSETNYLSSPVKLYEKYFEKISEEIDAFSNPRILQALAIVSFFGVLERHDTDLKDTLVKSFNIDWDELWDDILLLHSLEILDVYTDEIAKVSDQVLATYAFYKCFIDAGTSVIQYDKWIAIFIQSHQYRIKSTLIDVNNTFNYYHVKELVLPHLQRVLSGEEDEELLYSFHSVFWFYKGYDTLIYLKKWVEGLPKEASIDDLKFTYVHNDHVRPTRYFELLVEFWNHSNELLRPALQLGINLIEKQPSCLPEFLKFVNDHFTYKLEDVEHGYVRQNTLLDILLDSNLSARQKKIANGTFLNIIETLLGWHFTDHGSLKGRSFTFWNFDLHNSPELLHLRSKILEGFCSLFDVNKEQTQKILKKIVHPGGNIDTKIYIDELPIYKRLVSQKLSVLQYAHCKFVKRLSNKLITANADYPKEWDAFINSEIIKLSEFLKKDWEDYKGKTYEERELEKREAFKDFIISKNWKSIEALLYSIDGLYRQQENNSQGFIHAAVSDIFIAIAGKAKDDIIMALRMFFSGSLTFQLQARVINYVINQKILTGKELLSIINNYQFESKPFWIIILLNGLPENQIDVNFLELLIKTFNESRIPLPVNRMSDFSKFQSFFVEYKHSHPQLQIDNHNIITYLTEVLLSKQGENNISFGFHFCQECSRYFTNHLSLLKRAFIYLKNSEEHFDYDGKEFEAILKLDNNFFIEYLEQKVVDFDYLTFKLEDFKLDYIWSLPNYTGIIKKALDVIIKKVPMFSNWEHPSRVLFTFKSNSDELIAKASEVIKEFIKENFSKRQYILMIMNVVIHRFPIQFVTFLKQVLLLNKNIDLLKGIYLDKGGVYSGSRVPHIQREIDLCKEIIVMIKTLPDILDYVDHIDYLEKKIVWLKEDIDREQRRDFQEHYE
ncbi:MAG TPA: ATP-binding protein [Chitinophagaceae bacterium]|nr:ATP-binding protein [Chitinophagaceae bacterium]